MLRATLNTRVLSALVLAASTEETRYYLNGVCVEIEPRRVIYMATDGHIALCAVDFVDDHLDPNTALGRFIIPRQVLNGSRMSARKAPVHVELTASAIETWQSGDPVLRGAGLSFGDVTANFDSIDGCFPDLRRVIPRTFSGEAGHFDHANLARLEQAGAKMRGTRTCMISLHQNGKEPALVRYGGELEGKLFGLACPLQKPLETSGHPPIWIERAA